MLRLRPYLKKDADTILSWCQDEHTFYKWTAGVMGEYPLTKEAFSFVDSLIAFCALENQEVVGFLTMRNPKPTMDELRLGFVIVDPQKRGKGYGKEMLLLALQYAKEIYKAKTVSIGVFENNPAAYHCYLSVGFQDLGLEARETYTILGQPWTCINLKLDFDK